MPSTGIEPLDADCGFRQTSATSKADRRLAKILLLLACFALVYWILKSYKKKIQRQAGRPTVKGEDMVRCAQCGVHLPRSESLMSGQAFYCSVEHRPQHQKTD